MNRRQATVLVLMFTCIGYPAATPALGSTDELQKEVDAAAAQFFHETPQAVGVSIGILKAGQTYTFNYGTVKKGESRGASADSLYQIASVTKTFTGILLAQAALENKLRLEDDVRKYLKGSYPNLEFEGHPIRLCDLLDHRSGLPFFLPDIPATRPEPTADGVPWAVRITEATKNYTEASFMADLHKVKLTAVPGEKFSYSNAGAQLAAYVLEGIYGISYESLLKKKILMPLGMNDTAITLNSKQRAQLATGYDEHGTAMVEVSNQSVGAGGIKSSVNDMLKYERWQIAEQDAAVKLSHEPVFTVGNYSAGLNWQMLTANGRRLIWQEGNIDGYNSLALGLPEAHIGLVVLANEEDHVASHNLTVMMDRILKSLGPDAILLP